MKDENKKYITNIKESNKYYKLIKTEFSMKSNRFSMLKIS